MCTTLNFKGRSKTKNTAKWCLEEDPICRIWTRLVSWVRRYVRRHSWRKADSVILLCYECTITPQNLIKLVGVIFEKIDILNFFLMWTTLNFNGKTKIKKERGEDICRRTLDIEFERDWSVGLGATLGDATVTKKNSGKSRLCHTVGFRI